MSFTKVSTLDELWTGEQKSFTVEGERILLTNLDGEIYAYEDRCRHQGLPLSTGTRDGHTITCPAHLWQYDIRTGCGINPCHVSLKNIPTKIIDNDIFVDMSVFQPVPRA